MLAALPEQGVRRVAVVAPGFAADCLETLEEIAAENQEIFLRHGGEKFAYVPCLNDSERGIDVLVHLIERELEGWV
jgi:ferrochelatase